MAKHKPKKKDTDELLKEVKDEIIALREDDENYQADEILSPGDLIDPRKIREKEEEIAIDELLSSVPKDQGYYLKLYKVIGPTDIELKKKIDSWSQFSDLEWEITNIVRFHTKQNAAKWGSGKYRVVVWREGGIRGQARKPIDFVIDAEESPEVPLTLDGQNGPPIDPVAAITNQLENVSKLVNVVREANPTLKPDDMMKMVSDSFRNGQQVSESKEGSNSQVMVALIGMLGEIMKTNAKPTLPVQSEDNSVKLLTTLASLGVFSPNKEKENTMLESIQMFKELGLFPEKPKPPNPIEQLTEMKALLTLVNGMSGSGGKQTTMEKIIDVIGPLIPETLTKISETVNGYIQLKRMQVGGIAPVQTIHPNTETYDNEPMPMLPVKHTPIPPGQVDVTPKADIYGGLHDMSIPGASPVPGKENGDMQIKLFLSTIYSNMMSNNKEFFATLKNALETSNEGAELVNGISNKSINTKELVTLLQHWDKVRLSEPSIQPKLIQYCSDFINWIRSNEFIVTCSICNTGYKYDSKEEFDADTKKNCEIKDCEGVLIMPILPIKTKEVIVDEDFKV